MKRFLTTLFSLGLAIPFSVSAHTLEDIVPESYAAMQCMKLLHCTEGVTELSPETLEGESKELVVLMNGLGVQVYVSSPEYFVGGWRAAYYGDDNSVFVNATFAEDPVVLVRVLRHEGFHVAQDCMAGTLANSDLIQIYPALDIPKEYVQETIDRYGTDPFTVRIEREAVWSTNVPFQTVLALEVCSSETPMWEVYQPPSRSRSYLYINGYL